ncbi:growth hormone secretagogue receptor type 1-like [Mya arenaria]|uniref:growth hormone secretagogue receptor type 1-like n=1 Tax=Mya arenaria TaxID=6604 RepID=UPI0022DF938A|nr:growth hormone secretagogue receptor type 1-like [Mya arenaria]
MDTANTTVGPKLNTSSEFDNYTTRNPLNTFQRNSTDTVTDDEIERLSITMSKIQTVLCPTLFIVGILGNCFVISTVSHGQFRHMTVRIILLALALSDCLLLSTNPFNQRFMQDVMGRDVRAVHAVTCKVFFTVYRLGKTTSSWFVVMIAVERFVAVLFPLKVKTVVTKRNIVVAVASVYGVILILHSVWTVTTDINDLGICVPDYLTPETKVFHKTMTVIAVSFYSLIPLTILLFVTPPIIVKLLRLHGVRQRLNSNRGDSRADISRASAMLITVVLAYVVWCFSDWIALRDEGQRLFSQRFFYSVFLRI